MAARPSRPRSRRLLHAAGWLAALAVAGCGSVTLARVAPGRPATGAVPLGQAATGLAAPRVEGRTGPAPVILPSPAAASPLRPATPPAVARALPAAPALPGSIVALGDSITYGFGRGAATTPWGPPPAHSYPWDLERDLGVPVVNAGVSGTTAYGILHPGWDGPHRPDSLQLPALLALHPRLMIVGFGSNEAQQGWPIRETAHDLDLLLDRIAAAGVPLVLFGTHVDCVEMPCSRPAPGYPRQRYTEEWDAALTWLAARHGAQAVLDVESGFTREDLTDWIHPSAAGYWLIEQRLRPAVLRALDGAAETRTAPPAEPVEPPGPDPAPPEPLWGGEGSRAHRTPPLLQLVTLWDDSSGDNRLSQETWDDTPRDKPQSEP
jgi:lysophospholipase L1-like esterase